ncbi:Alcohol dehydrogenase [acceptor] [Leucoagaricus sp. SymC.cos]|nr:Alcohol dehydrogenase [acceptor] [Leucoagaricus sp. SymC.cos]
MNVRRDKRPHDVLREIKITYEGLARVDGSARFSHGDIASLASASGPIEVRLAAEQASQATFEVISRPLSNVPATEAKTLASAIRSALLPSLVLNKHPRTLIQVVVQALVSLRTQWKDPLVASMINASSLALLNTGSVPMRGVVCAVAIGRLPGTGLLIDPSVEECTDLDAGGCFAFIFAEGVGTRVESVWTSWRSKSGFFDESNFVQARTLAKDAAQIVYNAMKMSVSWMGTAESFELVSPAAIRSSTEKKEEHRDDDGRMGICRIELTQAVGMISRAAAFLLVQFLSIRCVLCVYDYVIIGGGNGGLVVASRLSEDPDVNVLVLEAGAEVENLREVYIPGMIGAGQAFTSLNWAYQTVPQDNMNRRNMVVFAGKALGGSTIINSMIMTRATRAQYDAIGAINNSTSWTWDELLPSFKRSEVFTPPDPSQTAHGASYDKSVRGSPFSTHPNHGQVKVGFPNFFFPQSEMFAKALIDKDHGGLGFQRALDLCDGDIRGRVGVSSDSLDVANNARCSAVCGYVTPFVNQRPNLQIITHAMVSKIEWANEMTMDGQLVARRVEYYLDGEDAPRYADVNADSGGEVVLAAGTIGTPKVMELSGVGNSSLLKSVGVDVKLDLPSVGENFGDHIHTWTSALTNASITKDVLRSNESFRKEQVTLWEESRTGLYSAAPRTIGLAAASDLLSTDHIKQLLNDARRDLDKYASQFANGNEALQNGIKAQHQSALDLYDQDEQIPVELNFEPGYAGPTPLEQRGGKNFSTINAILYSPLSRGRTHITSTNHSIPPLVDPAYWSHPIDVTMLTAGYRVARKALRTPPLDSIFVEEFEPGLSVSNSDEELQSYLRHSAGSDSHEIGTMAMMPRSLGGVVDTQLKVYGLRNVRVADASIIPMPISAHLASTVYMIGEKVWIAALKQFFVTDLFLQAADIIKSSKHDRAGPFVYKLDREL